MELIEVTDYIVDHVAYEKFGETSKREPVDTGAESLLNGAYGTLDFADVAVSGNDVQFDGAKLVVAHAFEKFDIYFTCCRSIQRNEYSTHTDQHCLVQIASAA